jgi:beta-glucosidase
MSPSKALLLAIATLLGTSRAQQNILNDTAFYGQSPDVPAPIANGTGAWAASYTKAKAFVSQLTLEEKVNLTGGISAENGCSGNIPAISRLGFEGMCLTDAGNGVRATDFVSGFPSGIHVGARFVPCSLYQIVLTAMQLEQTALKPESAVSWWRVQS